MIDRDLKFMSLQYQDKTLRIVPTGAPIIQKFHLGKKYAIITC